MRTYRLDHHIDHQLPSNIAGRTSITLSFKCLAYDDWSVLNRAFKTEQEFH